MNITSRQLKAFLLTAQHQSFSRAAEQLFITQSGMSVLVRELEAQLGFRLFDRTTRRVTLTEFGVKFLPIADRSVLELEAAAANIGRSATEADRHLSIGATPLVAAGLLPPAIAAYAKRKPELVCNYLETQIAMVESGAGLAVMPTLALPACLKRRVTLHALVDPVASGTLYWIVNRARKLPAAADGFNAFLRQYVSGVVERWPPAAAKAA